MAETSIRLLSNGYALVDASRGASDHKKYAKAFFKDADEFSEDMDDYGCNDLIVPAAGLTFEASIVQAGVVITGEAQPSDYRRAKKAGQELVKAVGIRDLKFGVDPFDS